MLDLYRLILDYSVRGKLVDQEFIEKFVRLEIKLKRLDSYIKSVRVLPKNEKYEDADAIYRDTSLEIYLPKIYKDLEFVPSFFDLFHNGEKIFYCNTYISQIILHEIEHANQNKKQSEIESIETDILRLSNCITPNLKIPFKLKLIVTLKAIDYLRLYDYTNYSYNPSERLAEIYSNQEMISILNYAAGYIPNLIDFFKTCKLESLVIGYKDKNGNLISPTLKYLHGLGMDKYLKEFSWYDKKDFNSLNDAYKNQFSLDERMKYGFPITEEEYDNTFDVLKRSRFF